MADGKPKRNKDSPRPLRMYTSFVEYPHFHTCQSIGLPNSG